MLRATEATLRRERERLADDRRHEYQRLQDQRRELERMQAQVHRLASHIDVEQDPREIERAPEMRAAAPEGRRRSREEELRRVEEALHTEGVYRVDAPGPRSSRPSPSPLTAGAAAGAPPVMRENNPGPDIPPVMRENNRGPNIPQILATSRRLQDYQRRVEAWEAGHGPEPSQTPSELVGVLNESFQRQTEFYDTGTRILHAIDSYASAPRRGRSPGADTSVSAILEPVATHDQTATPRAVDGLGDRRRSPSPAAEEEADGAAWDTLLATMPPDERLPTSARTSFESAPGRNASDDAAVSLSRSMTRSTSAASRAPHSAGASRTSGRASAASTAITVPSPLHRSAVSSPGVGASVGVSPTRPAVLECDIPDMQRHGRPRTTPTALATPGRPAATVAGMRSASTRGL